MKKTQRGSTLVEVLVAMTVFLIICGAIFTSVLGIANVVTKQDEALRISYLFADIEYFYKNDESDDKSLWRNNYCAYLDTPLIDNSYIMLDADMKPAENGEYKLAFDGTTVTVSKGEQTIGKRVLGGQNNG